jgi:isopentenyl-diphosphate delta-isomerase
MEPSEVDTPDDVASGRVLGVKNAARRKLHHELGIPLDQIRVNDLVFITRLRYWAADTITHGKDAPWGEHEIDYVLFWAVPHAASSLTLMPQEDEVKAVKWVSPKELDTMHQNPNLLFSPWFRLICQRWLVPTWWKDLEGTLEGKYNDYATVHSFDPPPEHFGGAGNASALFLKGNER